MKKITFIGAGSLGFTRGLVKDILTFDAFRDVHIALMDINTERRRISLSMKAAAEDLGIEIAVADPDPATLAEKAARQAKRAAERAAEAEKAEAAEAETEEAAE